MPGAKTLYLRDNVFMERYRCGIAILRNRNGRTSHTRIHGDPTTFGWTKINYHPW